MKLPAGLPDWVSTLEGRFDPALWWRPIVCTHSRPDKLSEADVIGLLFDSADRQIMTPDGLRGELQWSGGVVLNEGDVGISFTRVWATNETTDAEQRVLDELQGRGSMYIACTRGCTPRIPRADWGALIEAVRRAEPRWLDVSLYG